MSGHIQQAIETLEHELEALDQKRGDIETVISGLRKLAGEGVTSNGRKRVSKRANIITRKVHKRRPPPVKRAQPDRSSDDILAALRKKSPTTPRDLAAATHLTIHALRRRLNGLAASGQVTVTGATMNRQVSLGRARAAKEVP